MFHQAKLYDATNFEVERADYFYHCCCIIFVCLRRIDMYDNDIAIYTLLILSFFLINLLYGVLSK